MKFVNLFATGGTERQFVNLAQALDASRFDLRFGCFKRNGAFLTEIEALQIPVEEYKIGTLYHPETWKQQLRFSRYLRQHRIQIVHSYNFYANAFAIPPARLAGVPVVIASIRDMGAYLTPSKERLHRWVCGMADCVLTNARAIQEWLVRRGVGDGKIAVIENGIELSQFVHRGARSGFRDELSIPTAAPIIAVICRLSHVKGLDYFVEAAALLTRRFPEARFCIIGGAGMEEDRAYKRDLERYAAFLGLEGRLIFAGQRPDVSELLSQIQITVVPSLTEGLPNAALESLAAGVPVVATAVGGNPEAIEDGVSGLLIPPRDPVALAAAIGRLLEDPGLAGVLGEGGRRRIRERFSVQRMVERTERLYVDLLSRSKTALARGRVFQEG